MIWALLLIPGLTPALAQQAGPSIFAVGPAAGPTDLYQVDTETEAVVLLRRIADADCAGLEIHEDGLFSMCRDEQTWYLVRLDEEVPDVPILPFRESLGESVRTNRVEDFLLSDDRLWVLNNHSLETATVPAETVDLETRDRADGTLLLSRPTQARRLTADPFQPSRPFALFHIADRTWLGRVDIVADAESAQIQLEDGIVYRDFAFDAAAVLEAGIALPPFGRFLVITADASDGQLVRLAQLDLEGGPIQPLFEVPEVLEFLVAENVERESPPGEVELYAPFMASMPLGASATLVSSLMLLNASDSEQGVADLQIFDERGRALGGRFCPDGPPSPGQSILAPLSSLSHALDPLAGAFSGWAVVRVQGAVSGAVEVALVQDVRFSCSQPLEAIPSEHAQIVSIPLARPGRDFVAVAAITEGRETALSVVNPDPVSDVVLEIEALGEDGAVEDANTVIIGPRQRLSLLLFEWLIRGKVFLQPPPRPVDFRGIVRIRSDRPVAVSGLTVLLPEGKWSNLPITAAPGED
ncbi:MAG TPA: hypothetical protein VLV83_09880 [Acidobacteriota bacterium]|nr:hypothetical protein [Acidobacteriota bacterium]